MTTQTEDPTGSKGRKRGGTRRITQKMIVDAARAMDPQTLTMQAVADELGVDRKAVNYHVTDRDGLLRLVSADLFESTFTEGFESRFDEAGLTDADDWKQALRVWAATVRDGMVATGVTTNYFRLSDNVAALRPAELVLQRLLSAGFDLQTAGRGLAFVTHFAMAVARDIVMERRFGEHPQAPEVRRLLEQTDDDHYTALRGLASLQINGPDDVDAQFDFELDVFLSGLEQRLHPDPPRGLSRPV